MDKKFSQPIPTINFPSIKNFDIKDINEPLVSLSKLGIIVDSQYYKDGVPGSYKDIYLRETPALMLKKVNDILPNNYLLKVYDGYRPICVQERLWKFYRQDIINKHKDENLSDEEIDFKTSFFVSKPSHNILSPSLHNTGGAVDVTLIDKNFNELNMGTKFDDFSNKAWTNHYEIYVDNPEIRDNRRLLYWAMLEAGFTNLPSEWWHYDYGTKFWAYFTNQTALYTGILEADFPNRMPLF